MAPSPYLADLISNLTATNIAVFTVGFCTIYFIAGAVYNVYFHPLAKYPGPKRGAIFQHWISKAFLGGKYPQVILSLHEKYGPVVRTGPNQLSYCSPTSWKDIYGHVGGRKQFLKSEFYDDGTAPSIVSARIPQQHGKMRRLLSNGFSAKALSEQELLVQEYVDKLISQINVHATGSEGEEMVKWYNFCTFDIIGDLAFGDPFGSLSDGKPHFWVANILESIRAGAWIFILQKNPIIKSLIPLIVPKKAWMAREKHLQYSLQKVTKRMESKSTRKDLLSGLVMEQKSSDRISVEEMRGHASVIIVAGSETTATFLSGFSFHLCRNPDAYKKLVKEIRDKFSSYDQINALDTEHMPYLKAVLDESLRIYPPVPIGMPRLSPGETIDGKYVPEGTEVFTSSYAATHLEENFHRPYDFLPERWLDPDCKDKKDASQPFLLGSRVCLGRSLALMEMRLIMCKMLWVYDMELVDPEFDWTGNNATYILWNKPDLRLRYTRRPGIVVPPIDD